MTNIQEEKLQTWESWCTELDAAGVALNPTHL